MPSPDLVLAVLRHPPLMARLAQTTDNIIQRKNLGIITFGITFENRHITPVKKGQLNITVLTQAGKIPQTNHNNTTVLPVRASRPPAP